VSRAFLLVLAVIAIEGAVVWHLVAPVFSR